MPIQIIKKSNTTRKSIELIQDSSGQQSIKSFNINQPRNSKELFKLDFVFNTSFKSSKKDIMIETMEYLCWMNSNTKQQAEDIGWTEKVDKLEIFLGQALFMPHSVYYSCDTEFLRVYCPHITAMADVSADTQYSETRRNRK